MMRRIGIVLTLLLSTSTWAEPSQGLTPAPQAHSHGELDTYVCPMHAEVTATKPGSCHLCGMPLRRVEAHKERSVFRLELRTQPRQVRAGQPFTLALAVREESSEDIVTDLTVVHEKPFHLFVISRDLRDYFHVHPTVDARGVWTQELTLNRPGSYKVYADILPKGSTPQLLTDALEVTGPGGTPLEPSRLQVDAVLERTVGDIRAHLSLPPGGLAAAGHQALTFRFTDARTGAPVRDLEPYLGAWGHTVMLSEDMEDFVHAHPVEPVAGAHGGPQLTFHASPNAPGAYRIWTQIKRGGQVETIVFTVPVKPAR